MAEMEIVHSIHRPDIELITFAIDFDSTLVSMRYPQIGNEVPDAIRVLKKIKDTGHKVILTTMRCEKELGDAVKWLKIRGIELDGINENETQKSWTSSPKIHCDIMIDDTGIGCPLMAFENSLVVDWNVVEAMLQHLGVIV